MLYVSGFMPFIYSSEIECFFINYVTLTFTFYKRTIHEVWETETTRIFKKQKSRN